MKRVVLQILTLVAAAAVAGFGSNAVRHTLDLDGNDPQLLRHEIDGIGAAEAAALQNDPATLFLDARPAEEFAAGRIPGAVSFPPGEYQTSWEALRDFLVPEVRLVVYSEGTLPAVRVAQFLKERGQSPEVLEEGWEDWVRRGLPVERSPSP